MVCFWFLITKKTANAIPSIERDRRHFIDNSFAKTDRRRWCEPIESDMFGGGTSLDSALLLSLTVENERISYIDHKSGNRALLRSIFRHLSVGSSNTDENTFTIFQATFLYCKINTDISCLLFLALAVYNFRAQI